MLVYGELNKVSGRRLRYFAGFSRFRFKTRKSSREPAELIPEVADLRAVNFRGLPLLVESGVDEAEKHKYSSLNCPTEIQKQRREEGKASRLRYKHGKHRCCSNKKGIQRSCQ